MTVAFAAVQCLQADDKMSRLFAVNFLFLGAAAVASSCGQAILHDVPYANFVECGDGIVQTGEDCDDGMANSDSEPDACRVNCRRSYCGDGVVDSAEECDDGNDIDSDGCSRDCVAWLWTRWYNGAFDGDDIGYGIAANMQGDVFVAGQVWAGLDSDIWVRKYDPDGREQWTAFWGDDGGKGKDYASDIALDRSGNAVVVGTLSALNAQDARIWVGKYDSQGYVQWTWTQGGSDNFSAREGRGIAIDGQGSVVILAKEVQLFSDDSLLLIKLDASGSLQWSRTQVGSTNAVITGKAIAIDLDENILVAGTTPQPEDNLWLCKYSPNGTILWTRTYDGAPGGQVFLEDVVADSQRNVVVVGSSVDYSSENIWVRKYDSEGAPLWTREYGDWANGNDRAFGVTVDNQDNLLVTGEESLSVQASRVWIRKFDAEGNAVWTRAYHGLSNGFDAGRAVAVDPSDNVIVTGNEYLEGHGNDIWVRKYTP